MSKKKAISIFSATVMSLTTMFSGWNGFTSVPTANAVDDSSVCDLAPGTYIAPLYQCFAGRGIDGLANNEYQHFNGRAKLEITDDGKQIVTIGVENWDYYEAFVPMNQKYNELFGSDESTHRETSQYSEFRDAFPEKLLKQLSESGDANAQALMESSTVCTNKVDDFFEYGDTKYGDIVVDTNTHGSDSAYVSFEVNDYRDEFYVAAWANKPGLNGYEASRQFILDTADMFSLSELESSINSGNIGYRMLVPTLDMNTSKTNMVNYIAPKSYAVIMFDDVNAEIVDDNGNKKIIAKYHINTSNKNVKKRVSNYRKIFSTAMSDSDDEGAWNIFRRSEFSPLEVSDDDYVTVEYNYNSINDLIFGEYICADYQKTHYIAVQPVLAPVNETIEKIDESTGVIVTFKSSQIADPDKVEIKVESKPIDDTTEPIVKYGYSNDNSNWYKIDIIDNSTGETAKFVGGVNVYIPIPEHLTNETRNDYISKLLTPHGEVDKVPNLDYGSKYWIDENEIYIDGSVYYFLMNLAENETAQIKELSDGIYSAEAFLFKSGPTVPTYSMANGALIHKVYIVVENGTKKMYFNAQDISGRGYLGHIACDDVSSHNSAYTDDIIYTKYLTYDQAGSDDQNLKGQLVSNSGYDPITEWACVTGGILTLVDDSFIISNINIPAYQVAIGAPPMAAMGKQLYSEVSVDGLVAQLQFFNIERIADATSDNIQHYVIDEGYGFEPSALLRRIKQVELKFAANKGEAKLDAALAEANDVYTAEYADAAAASKAYEAAIAKLDAFEADYDMTKNLPDGKYIVTANMTQIDRVTASMSDAAINHEVVVNVKDGKATLQVEFKGLAINDKFGYLSRLWNYDKGYTYSFGTPTGTMTEAKVISRYDVIDQYSNDYPPHYLEFELVDGVGAEWIPLHVYVPVMTGSEEQNVIMHLDWSTARKAGEIAEYTGNTLSLKDDFGLNFFFKFGEQTLNDTGAKVQFTLPNGTVKEYVISETSEADKTANGYKFCADVAAKEMTVPVKAKIILSNGEVSDEFTCSVKEYADTLLSTSTNESETALVKAILNYGGYAQEFFGYNKTALANADLTDAEKTLGDVTIANTKREKIDDEDDGIDFYGSSLVLNTKIDVKAYFTLEDGAKISDYTFKIGSTELTPVEADGKYYVSIPDIASKNIDERSSIEIANKSGEGEMSVKTGPYAYINKVLTKSDDVKLQNVVKALYFYSQTAENYTA